MQGLIFLFIAIAGVAVAAGTYFGLTFTPIEAVLAGGMALVVAILVLERVLRRRAEARLHQAVEDLSHLLSTDAQAGQVLSQRINDISRANPAERLDSIEADLSVLGTVMRQVAEAVAELEDSQQSAPANNSASAGPDSAPSPPPEIEPIIPLEILRQAIADDRLIFHLQPIVTLPQRRASSYDVVPRLMLEDGELADPPDFMPRRNGVGVRREIERLACEEAIAIARRARTVEEPMTLNVPVGRDLFDDAESAIHLEALVDANRAITPHVRLAISEAIWRDLDRDAEAALTAVTDKGVGVVLTDMRSLRHDFADLSARGVRAVTTPASRFLGQTNALTDFHNSDIGDYLRRFGIDLVITDIANEEQILALLDDAIRFASGNYIANPTAPRPDLLPGAPEPARPRVIGGDA